MTDIQVAVLAIIQGITEFLPISSSGHLVLLPWVFKWNDPGLITDIAVHAGTVAAVIIYLWRDVLGMIGGLLGIRSCRAELRLLLHLCVATLPLVAAGAAMFMFFAEVMRNPAIIGWATIVFGILLYVVDRFCGTRRAIAKMTTGQALVIGLFQVLALIPGTSRSGITITAARLLGFDRTAAARFSMLLAIPAILAASVIAFQHLISSDTLHLHRDSIIAAAIAFVAALAAIHFLLRWVRKSSFAIFAAYRIILGLAIIYFFG